MSPRNDDVHWSDLDEVKSSDLDEMFSNNPTFSAQVLTATLADETSSPIAFSALPTPAQEVWLQLTQPESGIPEHILQTESDHCLQNKVNPESVVLDHPVKETRRLLRDNNRVCLVDSKTCEPIPEDAVPLQLGKFYFYKDRWVVNENTILSRDYTFVASGKSLTLEEKYSLVFNHSTNELCCNGKPVRYPEKYYPKLLPNHDPKAQKRVLESESRRVPQSCEDSDEPLPPTMPGHVSVQYKIGADFTLFGARKRPKTAEEDLKLPHPRS